jgi:hypothetical protein
MLAVIEVTLRQVFFPSTSVFPGSETPPLPHANLHLHVALKQKDKRAKPENLSKSSVISEMEERYVDKCFNLFFGL